MTLSKPDVTKFDNDDDSIKDARPEIETAFTSLNTMIDEYNNNGGTFGGKLETYTHEVSAGQTIYAIDNRINVFKITTGATITLKVYCQNLSATGSHFLFFDNPSGICNVEVEWDGTGFGKRSFQLVGGATDHNLTQVFIFERGDTSDSAGSNIAFKAVDRGAGFTYFTA